ncbi:MAG: hypothetical protein KAR45_23755 [Desulfobacteraceae bacterium]|nr:hypothetical protein [Desulfobacteraceae bacterium]MCK5311479.1 hypothetical protein [Desulfobacteraceae bacterium]
MIIISNVTYPPESAKEIAKRFLTAPALPGFLEKKGPYISTNREEGVHSMTLYEVDNSRLAEGLQAVGESLAVYIGVPGYTYDILTYYETEEGLRMIGM